MKEEQGKRRRREGGGRLREHTKACVRQRMHARTARASAQTSRRRRHAGHLQHKIILASLLNMIHRDSAVEMINVAAAATNKIRGMPALEPSPFTSPPQAAHPSPASWVNKVGEEVVLASVALYSQMPCRLGESPSTAAAARWG